MASPGGCRRSRQQSPASWGPIGRRTRRPTWRRSRFDARRAIMWSRDFSPGGQPTTDRGLAMETRQGPAESQREHAERTAEPDGRPYLLERVGEAAIAQLYADGFTALPRREKLLVWHLVQAAIAGRDFYFDQRYAHNLEMRELLEALVPEWSGMPGDVREPLARYTKLFWINSGPHNNLTAQKVVLECSPDAFAREVQAAALRGARMPSRAGEPLDALLSRLRPLFFDKSVHRTVTSKTPGEGQDILTA